MNRLRPGFGPGLIIIGSLSLWLAACAAGSRSQRATGDGGGKAAVGDFRLRDTKGKTHRLSDYHGKVVLVSFWATWCDPCQIELPRLQAIWKDLQGQGFELLTVAVDSSDQEAAVKKLIRRYRYVFPVLLDQETEVADRFNPSMDLPYSVLFDRKGNIAARHQGYRPGDEELIESEIRKLLASQ